MSENLELRIKDHVRDVEVGIYDMINKQVVPGIKRLDQTVYGNGEHGLTSKMLLTEEILSRIEISIKESRDDVTKQIDNMNQSRNKRDWTVMGSLAVLVIGLVVYIFEHQ